MTAEKEKKKRVVIEKERAKFRLLVAENPNYFGNQAETGYKATADMAGNTKYEELTCVGYHPDSGRLEATVAVKLPVGYGGNLCDDGTVEYVRFYLDTGGGWEDAGVAAFRAHDIPDGKDCAGEREKPLSYTATLKIDLDRKYCTLPFLPRVRAVLSWNYLPPADSPGWPPVWGNVLERNIQVKPRKKPLFADFLEVAGMDILKKLDIKLPVEEIKPVPIPLPDPPPLAFADLAELYCGGKGKKKTGLVEPHRFGLTDVKAALDSPSGDQQQLAAMSADWKKLGLSFTAAVKDLVSDQGNVSYEELECVGLDNNLEQLVATFRVKKSTGYSGGLCSAGSQEYISFWADWDDECSWTHMGTVQVNVHDIPIPPGGLHYSAFLPVDLRCHRRICTNPKIGRVRAVLSWNSPPPNNPDQLPYWGNRLDRHVQILPGKSCTPGVIIPQFHRIGGIRDDDIHNSNGLTLPSATFDNGDLADAGGRPCPFAERVVITGWPYPGHHYRIQVRKLGESWSSLTNTIKVEPLTGLKYPKSPVIAGEYYSYEILVNNPDLVLGWWESTGDDLWEVKLDILGQPGHVVQRVRLKNRGIEDIRIHISSGGDCKDFQVDHTLDGAFVARDPYLQRYSLGVAPFPAPAGQLTPVAGTVQTPSAPPEPAPPPGGLAWSLNTAGMVPCGYTVHLNVWDRAIRRSVPLRHHAHRSVGFCLRKKKG